MTQTPQNAPPPLPPATVEVDVDVLQQLVELIGSFPNATVADCIKPMLYISRVVTEATKQREKQFKADFAARAIDDYKATLTAQMSPVAEVPEAS